MNRGLIVISLLCCWGAQGCSQMEPKEDGQRASDSQGTPILGDNLAVNGSFEDGLLDWSTANEWYAQPKGAGTSPCAVDASVAKIGKASLRIDGEGKRGIAMQVFPISPGKFRFEGWIRCEALGDAKAELLAEWIDKDRKWLSGSPVGSVTGDADWTFISADVESPRQARYVHLDLLINRPNSGKAWFDGISFREITPPAVEMPPIRFDVHSPEGRSSELLVSWPGDAAGPVRRLLVFCEPAPFDSTSGLLPKAVCHSDEGSAVIRELENGRQYHVAVVPLDASGKPDGKCETRTATPQDRLRPDVVEVRFRPALSLPGHKRGGILAWQVRPVDENIERFEILAREQGGSPHVVGVADMAQRRSAVCGLPARTTHVGVRAVSGTGITGEPAFVQPNWPARATNETNLPTRITGFVRSNGRSLKESSVTARVDGAQAAAVQTDANGFFEFGGLPHGLIEIQAGREGMLASRPTLIAHDGRGMLIELELNALDELPYRLWTADPLRQAFRDEAPPAEPKRQINLLAPANDTECFQIVLHSRAPLKDVRVDFEPLVRVDGGAQSEVIDTSSFSYGFVNHVYVEKNSKATPPDELLRKAPDWFPDEIDRVAERDIEAYATQAIFLEFRAPKGTPAGVYAGSVRVHTQFGLDEVPVRFEVLPFEFPEKTNLTVVNWFSTAAMATSYGHEEWTEEHWRMIRHFARLMHAHHQNCVVVPRSLVRIFRLRDGRLVYDWSRFDRFCELFMEEGVGKRLCLSHWGSRATAEWLCPTFKLADPLVFDMRLRRQVRVEPEEVIAAFDAHLVEKGWAGRFTTHVADEPIPQNVESWREISARVGTAAPHLKRIDAIHVPDLEGSLEVWVPQLNYFEQWLDKFKKAQASGNAEVWFYVAWVPQGKHPNRLIDTEAVKPRIIHWMNYFYGATGYLHWALNQWHCRMGQFSPGDEWIIWPGRFRPNSSLRYEAQREGLEDCELLHMLQQANAEAAERMGFEDFDAAQRPNEITATVMRAFTDYTRSYDELSRARDYLLREIAEAKRGPLFLTTAEPAAVDPVAPGTVKLSGRAAAGVEITVNGKPMAVTDGRFSATVSVNQDSPEIVVTGKLKDRSFETRRRYRLRD